MTQEAHVACRNWPIGMRLFWPKTHDPAMHESHDLKVTIVSACAVIFSEFPLFLEVSAAAKRGILAPAARYGF
jgi:hypothetical protein